MGIIDGSNMLNIWRLDHPKGRWYFEREADAQRSAVQFGFEKCKITMHQIHQRKWSIVNFLNSEINS